MLFAGMMHLAKGLCFHTLLRQEVDNTFIRLAGTRLPTASKMEWQFNLPLKTLIVNKVSRCRRRL